MIFNEIMQKPLLLQYKMHMGLLRTPPQEGAQNRHHFSKSGTTQKRELIFDKLATPKSEGLK